MNYLSCYSKINRAVGEGRGRRADKTKGKEKERKKERERNRGEEINRVQQNFVEL